MDVFKYLEDDNNSIVQRFSEIIENYSKWATERVFEESKKAFSSVHQHIAQEAIVENNLKNDVAIERVLADATNQKKEITSQLEQIVELHIDEPGYEQSLEIIAKKYKEYVNLCTEQFYPSLKKVISPDELKHISDQLEQKVLN